MSDEDPTGLRARFQAHDFSGLPKENEYLKNLKRWLFRRGIMPDGDASEMHERLRGRLDETLKPLKRMMPPAGTTLLGDVMPADEKARYEARRRETNKKLQDESIRIFSKLIEEEGEAQWARIVDRRVRDNFYSVFIGLVIGTLIGYLAGKFL